MQHTKRGSWRTRGLPPDASKALQEILDREDPDIIGVVLSGSAARGMASRWSDVDVYVVRADDAPAGPEVSSAAVDEIPFTLSRLEQPPAFGSGGWWHRWSFAWAQVLRDDASGRVAAAVHRQATLTPQEQDAVLDARVDGVVNFLYRAIKSARDGRVLECRLDCAEAIPWLLEVIFAFSGRVRPFNKYLPWELREHPLAVPEWSAPSLLPQLERLLSGDQAAMRETFAVLERESRRFDADRGQDALGRAIDDWGESLAILRGTEPS